MKPMEFVLMSASVALGVMVGGLILNQIQHAIGHSAAAPVAILTPGK